VAGPVLLDRGDVKDQPGQLESDPADLVAVWAGQVNSGHSVRPLTDSFS